MLIIDYETYSPEPIENGSVKYAKHPETDIVCLGYSLGDQEPAIWLPGMPKPPELTFKGMWYAHNALFDYLIHTTIGAKYGLPQCPISAFTDSMALCQRYSLKPALADACEIQKTRHKKNPRGKTLIKQFCTPDRDGKRPHMPKWALDEICDYCLDDIKSTRDLIYSLPSDVLSDLEQQYWVLTQYINMRGLPVDPEESKRILGYIQGYAEDMSQTISDLSHGRITKATQAKRIVEWANEEYNTGLPNLTADTVEKFLNKSSLHPDVKRMLEIRQAMGRSSTAKFRRIIDMSYEGRVYNNLIYHGAGPGRWTGSGFQMHNLPRAKVKDPEAMIQRFMEFKPVEDPVLVGKALIRPMIKAPRGRLLMVSDYAGIENCLVMWHAGEEEALAQLRAGADQYVDMAASLYEKPHKSISDLQRLVGKIIILGCGYQMGGKRFKETATTWNVELTESAAYAAVSAYRKKYTKVVKMWKDVYKACVNAIKYPGTTIEANRCKFKATMDRNKNRWLIITLASGRNIFYRDPFLDQNEYGLVPRHYGIDPYTKKWSKLVLTPGRITENICQGTARDIMAHGMMNVEDRMPNVILIGSVHDEALSEIPEELASEHMLEDFNYNLCDMPSWADGLPLKAEGWIGKRYRK